MENAKKFFVKEFLYFSKQNLLTVYNNQDKIKG